MTLSVLISCMHQSDISIVRKSGVKTDAVVVNQCDIDDVQEIEGDHKTLFISTTERGLSRSRNKAIENALTDVCLIMDDDEILAENYEATILNAYKEYPNTDIIVFQVANSGKNYASEPKKIGYLEALKIGSWQVSFKNKSIKDSDIHFDVEMGSGTGHGAGEENAFLYSCLRKGLKIQYVPKVIAKLNESSESQWFHGYTPRFFVERGWATARYMGKPLAIAYAIYYAVRKHNLYKAQTPMYSVLENMLTGIFKKHI